MDSADCLPSDDHQGISLDDTVTRADLVGTWWLSKYFVSDEGGIHVVSPLGLNPVGQLIHAPDTTMSVQVLARDRPPVSGERPVDCRPDERASFALTHFGYAGHFEIVDDVVRHHVAVASFPTWTGQTLTRRAVLTAGQLELTGIVPNSEGVRRSVVLQWRRDMTEQGN